MGLSFIWAPLESFGGPLHIWYTVIRGEEVEEEEEGGKHQVLPSFDLSFNFAPPDLLLPTHRYGFLLFRSISFCLFMGFVALI